MFTCSIRGHVVFHTDHNHRRFKYPICGTDVIHAVVKRCALMLVGMCAVGLRVLLGVRVFLYVFA